MAQQETSNTVSSSRTSGPVVQIGTASGPITIGDGPQYNDMRSGGTYVTQGAEPMVVGSRSGVSSIPLDAQGAEPMVVGSRSGVSSIPLDLV
ncbi:hypothetical protein [Kitasatospora sp. NPDC057541]|uniref:hypothetical protein n=1 Tax=unclassified Kitasatospora TaxID=2633591 RepID=UPI0036762D79